MTPTERTLKAMRERGYHAAVVERWNRFAGVRQDLFGWIDLVGAHPSEAGVLGVQTTTGDHAAERMAKASGNGALVSWLLAGGRLAVWAWSKRKALRADGKRSKRDVWTLREIPVTLADLTAQEAAPDSSGGAAGSSYGPRRSSPSSASRCVDPGAILKARRCEVTR